MKETQKRENTEASEARPGESKRYLGSVAFYKHMIVGVVLLLILVPVIISIIQSCRLSALQKKYRQMELACQSAENALTELEKEQAVEPAEPEEEPPGEDMEEPETEAEEETAWFREDPKSWRYILVNESHPLAADYTMTLTTTRNGQQVDCRIVTDLEDMLDAAAEAGYELIICSSYRDYERQDELMKQSIAGYVKQGYPYKEAFFESKKTLAMTGASEHHTGLAVDIVGIGYQSLDSGQAEQPEAIWLKEHCAEYGFILRYTCDKEAITGIHGESWHFRYVGKKAAAYMTEHRLCLEEFCEMLGE